MAALHLSTFKTPLLWGGLALILELHFSIRKDLRRRLELRYGRRIKGPMLVSPHVFTRTLEGDGIGFAVEGQKKPLRIPRAAENKHILTVGDTGAGKSTIIRQILFQVAERKHCAIVYDPAGAFIPHFYDEGRGDIVLNPLDARCPYWSPSDELQRKAEAKAIAVSLFQPAGMSNRFFVESPQKIFAHLLGSLPTPTQLVEWMSHPEEIDRRVKSPVQSSGAGQGYDRSRALLGSPLQPGHVLRYSRGSKVLGIGAAGYARVVSIDQEQNLLTVQKPSGARVTYDPKRLSGVSVYQRESNRLR
jgi:hypothetical protein